MDSREHFGDFAGKKYGKTCFFSFFWVFLFSWNSGGSVLGFHPLAFLDWEGQAPRANLLLFQHVGVGVFNVGGWLTHGDLALEVGVDFVSVVEHRLIPARVRSEWTRLREEGVGLYLGSCFSGFLSCG